MKANVGGIDKVLRIIAGIAALSLFFFLEGNSRFYALIGFVPLLTGLIGWCPIYPVLGLSTCPMKK